VSGFWQWVTTHEVEAIGLVLGVVGIILAIYYGTIQIRQQRKVLDWELNADESIVGMVAAKRVTSGLSVRYNDLPLTNPRIIVMHIINTGRQEITESDFTSANYIEVSVPDAEILAGASVTDVSDSSVYPVGPLDQALVKVELRPRTMKRKSWLKLQLIVDGGKRPVVSAKFANQSRPMRELVESTMRRGWKVFYLVPPLILIFVLSERWLSPKAYAWLSYVIAILMLLIVSWALFMRRRIKRAWRKFG
jgi:hypothetical protein